MLMLSRIDLKHNSIPDLPNEVIEEILASLSYTDLKRLSREGNRLEECAKRVLKKKPFRKYI